MKQAERKERRRRGLLAAGLMLLAAGLFPPALSAQAERSPFRITGYDLEVELLPEVHQLTAQARLSVVANEPLASLRLHLHRNLKVEKVTDGGGQELPFEQLAQAGSFRVDLPQTVQTDQPATLAITYAGGFDPAIKPERGPQLAVISPAGTYLLRAAQWFPGPANLWERHSLNLSVTLPQDFTVIASGRAQPPEMVPDGKARFGFRLEEPSLGGTVVAGKYEKVTLTSGAPLNFYLSSVPQSYARENAETLANILTFFSARFGALKDPALAVVETPDDTWEAYSAPGMLLLPVRQWSSSINERLLARWVARQWWEARVSPADANSLWLTDGLSRYSEALYVEDSAGEEGFHQALEDFTIGALVDESATPIGGADRFGRFTPEFNSVVRDKGAMVFHMLRSVLGDEAFFRLLEDYARRFAGRTATLEEFERLAEEVGGQPLDYFFGQWVRSTGVPQFSVDYVVYRTQEGFRVAGTINHEVEIFRMPVPVRIETEGPPVTEVVQVAGPSSDFSIQTFGKPLRIQVDPQHNVLHYTPDLRVRVAIARGEGLFQQGQYFEATREYQRALEVKRNSSLAHYRMGEAFFEQRNYQAAANSFREAINGDQEPKWTVVWSHILLGKIFDLTGQRERAINEYRRAIDTNDNTQGAQAEAEKYLREPYRRETRAIEEIQRP